MDIKLVTLNDRGLNWDQTLDYYERAAQWANEHCSSYLEKEIIDVADFSYEFDLLAVYRFANDQDAFMFQLCWAR